MRRRILYILLYWCDGSTVAVCGCASEALVNISFPGRQTPHSEHISYYNVLQDLFFALMYGPYRLPVYSPGK